MSTFANGITPSQMKPCNEWAQTGQCGFGRSCAFSHEQNMERPRDLLSIVGDVAVALSYANNTQYYQRPAATSHSMTNQTVCEEWKAKGRCFRGTQCLHGHPTALRGAGSDDGYSSSSTGGWGRANNSASSGSRPPGRAVASVQRQMWMPSLEQQQRRESLAKAEKLRERERIAKLKEAKEEREKQQQARKAEMERTKYQEKLAREAAAKEAEIEQREQQERLVREAAAKEAKERHREQQAREATVIEQCIVLDSSLVTFAAGLNILHAIPGFDLCKIIIKNLPTDTRPHEILDLFTQQDLQSHDFHVTQYPTATSPDAVVLVNKECRQAVAAGLEGIDFRGDGLSFVMDANTMDTGMGEATNKRPFILVSWDAPSDTFIATYSSLEEAREKAKELNMKDWKGRQIRVFINQPPPGSSAARHFFNPASIKILGLPYGTSIDYGLFEFLGSMNVRKLKSSIFDLPTSFDIIRRTLSRCNGVQMDTYEIMNNGERGEAKVKVNFAEWEDAQRAHTSILGVPAGPPKFRFTVSQQPVRYTIKIPRQQYEAQKRQWNELSERQREIDAYVDVKFGDRGDVFLRVLGKDKKAISTLKVAIERMVAGEKLDATCWHSSFTSVDGRRCLNHIMKEKTVFIRHDFKSQSLRAYGETRSIEEARSMVLQEIRRISRNEITRDIVGRGSVGFFVREGLGKLAELLGEGNVKLDLASRPCKVTVKGGDEAKHHLQRLIDESQAKAAFHEGAGLPHFGVTETCPVCMDDVSNPEELACGHTYCSSCLKLFLTSAADGKKFPIVCIANDASCNVPLSIPLIRRFLPVQAFQSLMEAAFVLHLDQHEHELKYCTTPDCKQIYRRRTDVAVLKCPSCFSAICAACGGGAHDGMACTERRLHSNPEEQEQLNNALATAIGYEKCPRCNIWIERVDGCNHLTCECGAHICWSCTGFFSLDEIYEHMIIVHHGINERGPPTTLNPSNDAELMAQGLRQAAARERGTQEERRQTQEELEGGFINSCVVA
ncbi:hypothetical protein CPC08DRAFT_766723 [Agrocybe pediades]|nr:hypothetical protein CPC08DRAFT_766723 [Agrocybe pediades]